MRKLNMNNSIPRYILLFFAVLFLVPNIILIIRVINNQVDITPFRLWRSVIIDTLVSLFLYSRFLRRINLNGNSIVINMPPRKICFSKDDVQECVYNAEYGFRGKHFIVSLKSGKRIIFSVISEACISELLDFFELDKSALR